MGIRQIDFYKTRDNKCPVEVFLDSLPSKTAQKVTWVLRLLEDLEVVPARYFKKLVDSEGIWECRVKLGSNIYRVFAFYHGPKVILTHGFIKKTQKTPARELDRARRIKEDFLERVRKVK